MSASDDLKKLKELTGSKMNLTKVGILLYLAARGEVTFKQLYEDLGLTPGNAWSHLEKLEREELVKMRKVLGKGRPKVMVSLTPKGYKEVDKLLDLLDIIVKLRQLLPRAGEGSEGP